MKIFRFTIVLVSLVITVSNAVGQTYYFIDESRTPTDKSIVREYGEHQWVVYNNPH